MTDQSIESRDIIDWCAEFLTQRVVRVRYNIVLNCAMWAAIGFAVACAIIKGR
jgi:hypothetical protein